MVKVVAKVPVSVISVAAKKFSKTLEDLAGYVRRFEKKAKAIDEKINGADNMPAALKKGVERGKDTLETFEKTLTAIEFNVEAPRDGVDDVIQTRDTISSFSPGVADSFDDKARGVNDDVEQINRDYDAALAAADRLVGGIEDKTGVISALKKVQGALDAVANELAVLRSPLALLQAVVKPFEWALNAVDFVYKTP